MKRIFAALAVLMSFGLICDVRGTGVILVSNLGEGNIGSYNFGTNDYLATPFQTGSSAISVQQVSVLMQQYQQVGDEPFIAIYTDNGSHLPGTQIAGATFSPQSTLTATMAVNTFTPSSAVTLQANTTYDLVVGAKLLDGYWAWGLVNGAGSPGSGATILADSSELFQNSWETLNPPGTVFGFDLVGTVVPEPSMGSLFGMAAIGMFVLRRRRGE